MDDDEQELVIALGNRLLRREELLEEQVFPVRQRAFQIDMHALGQLVGVGNGGAARIGRTCRRHRRTLAPSGPHRKSLLGIDRPVAPGPPARWSSLWRAAT